MSRGLRALLLVLLPCAGSAVAAPRLGLAVGPALTLTGAVDPGATVRGQLLTGGAFPVHVGVEGGLTLFPGRAVEERCTDATCAHLVVTDRATDALWHLGFAVRAESAAGWRPFFSGQLGYVATVRYGAEHPESDGHGASLSLGGGVRPWALGERCRLGLEASVQGLALTFGDEGGGVGALGSLTAVLDFD
ncbi:hypothetical protein FGE12_14940 [Aggregicoccus sp. 17bor-14]|nr:hypothetical protein [Simulacricoccus sp. 17bor-14]MRI89447.1 hypothetical protein [Aggregicoccus sp. 17bor-14]